MVTKITVEIPNDKGIDLAKAMSAVADAIQDTVEEATGERPH